MNPSQAKEIVLEAIVENLVAVNAFVDEVLSAVKCAPKKRMQLDIAIEELFVNIAHYAYHPGQGKVTVRAEAIEDPLGIRLAFIDEGIPYNPLLGEKPDVTLPLEEREIGGLGIFLVRKNVDSIDYEYRDGKNRLTVWKNLA